MTDDRRAVTDDRPDVPALARAVLEEWFATHPEDATRAGDHRYDDRLDDLTEAAELTEAGRWHQRLAEVDQVDDTELTVDEAVDLEILRTRLSARLLEIDQTRDAAWNPLVHNPGAALHALLARDHAPLPDRLRALAGRLGALPERLAAAERRLVAVPGVHARTALEQAAGTAALVRDAVDQALVQAPSLRGRVEPAQLAALEALERHQAWLAELVDSGRAAGDPRLGPELFAAKLWLTLDTDLRPEHVLEDAYGHLERVEAEIEAVAASLGGGVREVLDRVAVDHPDDATIVERATRTLAHATAAARAADLVTIPADPVRVLEMPEFARGVSVAYCDPPGPLEPGGETFYAIAPTPVGWSAARRESFYREYNDAMLVNLSVHEAMPGHALQLAHSRRHTGGTDVRRVFWSGTFAEGWAVYVERLMADPDGPALGGPAVRMQQLKMALRMTINAILDAGVHAGGMTEAQAMDLLMRRGHQEEGEAAGKWRRALLTSAQLSTYFVGFTEVARLVGDLRAAGRYGGQRARHDALLAHGSPPPRHLRTLLGPV